MPTWKVTLPDGSEFKVGNAPTYQAAVDEVKARFGLKPQQEHLGFDGDVPKLIPGPKPVNETPSRSAKDAVVGAGEVGLSLLTGATGGTVGYIDQLISEAAKQMFSGNFGSPGAADAIEQSALQGAGAMTYAPKTEEGAEYARNMAGLLGWVPPIIGVSNPSGLLGATNKARGSMSDRRAVGREIQSMGQPAPSQTGSRSAGAAQLTDASQRRALAETMPVPFTGESALTTGQASRNFAQLQFEKEKAKLGDLGQPLRDRAVNQNKTFEDNFETLKEKTNYSTVEPRELGYNVDAAVKARKNKVHAKVGQAYTMARNAGEMKEPVSIDGLPATFDDMFNLEGQAGNITVARKEALRLGVLSEGEDGLQAIPASLDTIEDLRKRVVQATDWRDPRQATAARRLNAEIDAATKDKGGDLYKRARRLAASEFNEFRNSEIAKDLLAVKGDTTARRIALENVADRIIVSAPLEEMNKIRTTLLSAGDEGKQAWQDLKAYGIAHIQNKAYGGQYDEAGQPMIKPYAFSKEIQKFDKSGKLASLYGKKQAQIMRDLAELAVITETAPTGAINHSNTSSAIQMAIVEAGVTASATGLPIPAVTAIREASRLLKNKALKVRINNALAGK